MNDLEMARACADKMYSNDDASRGLGIEIEIPEPGAAIGTMTVRQDMLNGYDVCHGGFVFALADSVFAFACNTFNNVTLAAGADISFLRPVYIDDRLTATGRQVNVGKRSGIYDVDVTNQDGKLVAVFRGRSASMGQAMID